MLVLGSNFDICYITSIFKSYGWSGRTGRDDYGNPYTNSITGTINGITTNIASIPLYFSRSGYVDGSLINAGSSGYYWSSTANSATYAYTLDFYSSTVNPSNNNGRYYGFSVRCVAR